MDEEYGEYKRAGELLDRTEETFICDAHGQYKGTVLSIDGTEHRTLCPVCSEERAAEYKRAETLFGIKEETLICGTHGRYAGRAFTIDGTEHRTPCPVCAEERAAELKLQEHEDRQREYCRRFELMNIDERYKQAGFGNFIAGTPELKRHLAAARDFASRPQKERGQILMVGGNGTGKTHLAAAVLIEILKKDGTGGFFIKAKRMNAVIRSTIQKPVEGYGLLDGAKNDLEIVERLGKTPLLAIDEIGRDKGSDFNLNCFSDILDERYGRRLPTIFISNFIDSIQNHFGADIMSRFTEEGTFMEFTGEDYRRKLGAARRAGV
jgi:DNA replication protein DnaC